MLEALIKKLTGNRPLSADITEVWNRCHPHLVPLADYLPLPAADGCELPDGGRGVKLQAHLRLKGGHWLNAAPVAYDAARRRFYFLDADRQALLAGQPELLEAPVDAVNARLWFAEPTFLNIEPTTRCNFNCWYCVGRSMKQEDIRVEDFAKVLDNFPSVKTIALVGEGEPLMHKGFFDMADMARARGIRIMIISNGSAFSQSVIEKLCKSEIAYVSISIDSADPETFASSRLDGDLNKIWQGIEKLRKYRDDNGYKYPVIALKGTLFSHTQDQIPQIVEAAKSHGVEVFESFQPLNPMSNYVKIYPKGQIPQLDVIGEVAESIRRDSHDATKVMKSMQQFCDDAGIDFSKSGQPNGLRQNCDEQWIYSLLSGDVTPCCQIKTPISPKWNLFDHSLADILREPQYENVRFNLWNGFFPTYCDGCWKTRR
jgi:MoaA/NifB/PqqE/SkfB family radical SAM enzyme